MPGPPGLLRVLSGALFLSLLLLSLDGQYIRPADAFTNCDVADLTLDGQGSEFLGLINNYRAQYGLQQLTASENLTRAAAWMASDMATRNYFAHLDSSGRLSQARIADCGGSMSSGEILAAGPSIMSPSEAFQLWRNSPAHNIIMLDASYRQIGIAHAGSANSYYTSYWAVTFDVRDDGSRIGSTAATAAAATMTDPVPGSHIGSPAYAFQWRSQPGVYEYWLDVGSCPGCNDIYSASHGLAVAAIVVNLPRDGRNLYVRLSMRTANGWIFEDYVYTSANLQ